ncbi:MAG: YhgE/Pip family protein [Mycoplasma sp.]|nr:YhgE/Pip family protein [Mycoplasma sp.]
MFKGFKTEFKKGIFGNRYRITRYLGVLILPLIYSFMYIFAFFDPFTKLHTLDMRIYASSGDSFGQAFAQHIMNDNADIQLGEIGVNVKFNTENPNYIYSDVNNVDTNSGFGTVVLKPNFGSEVLASINDINSTLPNSTPLRKFDELVKHLSSYPSPVVDFNINFKKNYVIGLGLDVSTAMQPVFVKFLDDLIDTGATSTNSTISTFFTSIENHKSSILPASDSDLNLVNTKSIMSEHAKYGFGLAPFFLSIGMWVGSMGITLAINPKIYDKKIGPMGTFFGKLLAVWLTVITQLIILFSALYLIGFSELGSNFWNLALYGVIIGLCFSTMVFSIRFMIPNKTVGILTVLIILVFQMVSSGGLFPVETQNWLFKFLHPIVPFTYSVSIFRELTFQTSWLVVFANSMFIFIYAILFVIGGYYVYQKRKHSEFYPIILDDSNKIKEGSDNV